MRRILYFALVVICSLTAATGELAAQGDDGAVINDAGIAVKLITTRNCQLYAEPDENSNSAPCRVFSYWYVLPPDKNAVMRKITDLPSLVTDGFYRVSAGDNEVDFKGYIHKDDAVEWHHRQAICFASRQYRELANFYETKDVAESVHSATGATSDPIAREPESTAGNLILMPLLDSWEVTLEGQEMEMYDVAFMAARPDNLARSGAAGGGGAGGGGGAAGNGELTKEEILETATVDIVFVLDSTASMQPEIDAVCASVKSVAEKLAQDTAYGGRMRFGLVCFRDIIDNMGSSGLEYLTKVFCTLNEGKDHQKFYQRLSTVRHASVGSGDYPEDMLAGLSAAMEFDQMGWNEAGWKQLVVVSDASIKGPHHEDPQARNSHNSTSIEEVMTRAQTGGQSTEELQRSNFVISTALVKRPNTPAADYPIALEQYKTLVAGRTYTGDFFQIEGTNLANFSDELTTSILKKLENFKEVVEKGTLSTAPAQAGGAKPSSAEWPFPLLDLISSAPSAQGQNTLDMRFSHGYCTEFDTDGNRVFVPHVFVRQGQLKSFNYVLQFLQNQLEEAGDPGSRDVQKIVKGMQTISMSLNLAEPIDPNMELSTFLQRLIGFPLKTQIFYITLADLAAMSQVDYDDWTKKVKACTETLAELIENPNIWKKLHQTARDVQYHAFINMNDLP